MGKMAKNGPKRLKKAKLALTNVQESAVGVTFPTPIASRGASGDNPLALPKGRGGGEQAVTATRLFPNRRAWKRQTVTTL